jgi:hypothetical protein
MTRWIVLLSLLAGPALRAEEPARAQDKGEAMILGVEVRCGPVEAPAGTTGPEGRYMKKFMEDIEAPEAVFDVRWQAPQAGLPPGCIVRLDVLRAGNPQASSFEITYDERIVGRRVTTFTLPRSPGARAAAVAAWRVQVIHSGKVLAAKASDSWR